MECKWGEAAAGVHLLRQSGLINSVIVQSFDWAFLRACHKLEPEQVLGALGPPAVLAGGRRPAGILRGLNALWLREVAKTGAKIVVWNRKMSRNSIHQAHRRGLRVWVYTIDEPAEARRLIAAGGNGIITNNVALIKNLIT